MWGCPPVPSLSGGQQRSGIHTRSKHRRRLIIPSRPFVPVVDRNQKPLMPTKACRAEAWIRHGKATPFWKKGVFCVRLNQEPSERKVQQVAVGIDPGSKREAFTVKSKSHTYLNVLTETPDWIKDGMEKRRNARRARRQRNTPCRQPKFNRTCLWNKSISPSTKARWQWKLRVADWLLKMFPVSNFIVEDIKAESKGKKEWDMSFTPLEVGKAWFYSEIKSKGQLATRRGYETKTLRDLLGLKKSKSKLDDKFECHNVDSWVLANDMVGGHSKPDNVSLIKLVPLHFHRRQLHVFQSAKDGIRKTYGGTRSLGFKRGSLVKHKKHGFCYVGGAKKNRISLRSLKNGKGISRDARTSDIKFLGYSSFRRSDV